MNSWLKPQIETLNWNPKETLNETLKKLNETLNETLKKP